MSTRTYAETANRLQEQQRYTRDGPDREWMLIEPFTQKPPGPGRERTVNMRAIVNAIFYRAKTGCQWHLLPKVFPDDRHVW